MIHSTYIVLDSVWMDNDQKKTSVPLCKSQFPCMAVEYSHEFGNQQIAAFPFTYGSSLLTTAL